MHQKIVSLMQQKEITEFNEKTENFRKIMTMRKKMSTAHTTAIKLP